MPNVEPSFVLYALLLEPGGCVRAHITLFELVEPEEEKKKSSWVGVGGTAFAVACHETARLSGCHLSDMLCPMQGQGQGCRAPAACHAGLALFMWCRCAVCLLVVLVWCGLCCSLVSALQAILNLLAISVHPFSVKVPISNAKHPTPPPPLCPAPPPPCPTPPRGGNRHLAHEQ